ncbi:MULTISPECIES: GAF domain-containing protein [Niastella]|uniref:GAF domain-containing protein n=1 Tax=Niastella soli TaxID=2821487 RepID=A0ABS3YZX4_9BACT|nr:GAF domain-containing protein [Niastella soli]MBO9203476.1 GAF domain-containing protein [Niastella soli]
MSEMFAPAIGSVTKVNILAANRERVDNSLSIDSKISFRPFVNYLKEKLQDSSNTRSRIYNYLIERFEETPALLEPVTDAHLLEENQDLLDMLSTTLFPVVSEHEKNMFTMSVPYEFSIFNYSTPFRKLFVDETEEHFLLPDDATEEILKQAQCALLYEHILEKFYNIKLNEAPYLIYPVEDKTTGMKRYYKLRYDRRFIDIFLKGELPQIQDCGVCLNTLRILDMEKQLEKMPLDLFEVEGFGVWIAEDFTIQETLDSIKRVLLRHEACDTSIVNDLKENIQALVGFNNVEVGITPFLQLNNRFVLDETCTQHGILGKSWRSNDPASMATYQQCIEFFSEHPAPMPLSILDEKVVAVAPFTQILINAGIRSYIIIPIQNNDGLLGILELASPIPNQLDQEVMNRVEKVMPLLSLALLKNRDTFTNRIEKIIKEKFTALQPSVEWKFAEAAWEYMNKEQYKEAPVTGNVVFDNVYPLYGAIDIRNSSVERSRALQKDLLVHIQLIDETFEQLQTRFPLPLLEGLKFKNFNFQQAIEQGVTAEDEIRINEFFNNEVHTVLKHLKSSHPQMQDIINNYFYHVNDFCGFLYRNRNDYEISLNTINNAVLHTFQQQETIMQQSYPHYFEKYKTDGVEYTIYIGQSIAPHNPFNMLFLKNLQLFQLTSMAEIAQMIHTMQPTLPVPLQTTQLILIHSQPMSISFRRDERRFDVEGSYNIRYEIMKKRLDKVHICGTQERLTQPGKIAMVYSNPKEAEEYQEYILFLQNKKLLQPGIECLELEELQGVSGLKALRVNVNLEK